jgi:hypothetical protein
MPKQRRRRTPNRSKPKNRSAGPPSRGETSTYAPYQAPTSGGGTATMTRTKAPAPTRMMPAHRRSRRARQQRWFRLAMIIGAVVGLSAAIVLAGKMGKSTIAATAISAKVLQPTLQQGAASEGSFSIVDKSAQLDERTMLRTDGTGFAELTYGDGSLSRIGDNTTYEITRSRVKGDTRDLRGALTKGKSWHNVKPNSGDKSVYEVKVLGGTGTVKGTAFATTCEVAETDCFYTVVKGIVHLVDSAGRTADLGPGDRVEVSFGKLGDTMKLTAEELAADPWIAQNMQLDAGGELVTTTTSIDPNATTTTFDPNATTTTLFGATTIPGVVTPGQRTTTPTRAGGGSPPPPPPQPQPPSPATTTATSPPATEPPATTTTAGGPPTTHSREWCQRHPQNADCK